MLVAFGRNSFLPFVRRNPKLADLSLPSMWGALILAHVVQLLVIGLYACICSTLGKVGRCLYKVRTPAPRSSSRPATLHDETCTVKTYVVQRTMYSYPNTLRNE